METEGTYIVANNRISAVLVSTDLERSQRFYETKVGLTLSAETIKNHLVFECGDGTTLLIYGRGSGNKADHTQVRFWSTELAPSFNLTDEEQKEPPSLRGTVLFLVIWLPSMITLGAWKVSDGGWGSALAIARVFYGAIGVVVLVWAARSRRHHRRLLRR